MKINEIKKTVETVVRTEYIAEDGEVFYDKEQCEKYEQSALFAISKQLKRLSQNISAYDINDDLSDECEVEIFDIQTSEDLLMLKRYCYLKASTHGASEKSIEYFMNKTTKLSDGREITSEHTLDNLTFGHEVMVFWDYDRDHCWVYRNGSVEDYSNYFKDRINKLITSQNKEG